MGARCLISATVRNNGTTKLLENAFDLFDSLHNQELGHVYSISKYSCEIAVVSLSKPVTRETKKCDGNTFTEKNKLRTLSVGKSRDYEKSFGIREKRCDFCFQTCSS